VTIRPSLVRRVTTALVAAVAFATTAPTQLAAAHHSWDPYDTRVAF
jgi:hypothetical protein